VGRTGVGWHPDIGQRAGHPVGHLDSIVAGMLGFESRRHCRRSLVAAVRSSLDDLVGC